MAGLESIRSEMGWSTQTQINVRGFDLPGDLLGNLNFGDMAFLELMARTPTPEESSVFNACLVALVEHGLTPSVIAARLTYLGAPESLQGAVAAGLLGAGNVFLGTIEGSARMLQDALLTADASSPLQELAERAVSELRGRGQLVPGIGHPVHKPEDPRCPRLIAIAEESGCAGRHLELMLLVQKEAEKQYGRTLPLNATGAIGAISSDLGIPWAVARGLGVMARSVGLVAHVLEEIRQPMAATIWHTVEDEATAHIRPVSD